jgi:E3 ubiquitin-protein ligase HUWE1
VWLLTQLFQDGNYVSFCELLQEDSTPAVEILTELVTLTKDICDRILSKMLLCLLFKFSKFPNPFVASLPRPLVADIQGLFITGMLDPEIAPLCANALGNYMSCLQFTQVLFDLGKAPILAANLALAFGFGNPHERASVMSMMIYVIKQLFAHESGLILITQHANAEYIVANIVACLDYASEDECEALDVLGEILASDARHLVLSGNHIERILFRVACMLSDEDVELDSQLNVRCCILLQALAAASDVSVLLCCSDVSPKIIAVLSRFAEGKKLLFNLMPVLQWHSQLVQELSLEFKKEWVSWMIRSSTHATCESIQIVVYRGQLLEGLCVRLEESAASLRNGIDVQFRGNSETGGGAGHRREFFRLTSEELTNADAGLFKSNDGGRSLHISSTAEHAQPDNLAQFELCGKLIGLALLHGETLPAMRFTAALRKLILGLAPLTLGDMATVDPGLYEGKVKYLMQERYKQNTTPCSLEELDLKFEDCPQPDVFPDVRSDLCSKGASVAVTEDNKLQYLKLLCDHRMRRSVSKQLEAMLRGFKAVVPEDLRQMIRRVVTPDEFSMLLCGVSQLDVNEWRLHSLREEGMDDQTWDALWEVIEQFSQNDRGRLLEFVTGSSTLPAGGFARLPGFGGPGLVQKFTVVMRQQGLPTAATCFNRLYLPPYEDTVKMRSALLEAIAHKDSGFHEGAVAQ